MKTWKLSLLCSLVGCLFCSITLAQKAVVIGKMTNLQKKVIGTQTMERKAITPTTTELEESAKKQLNGVGSVYIDTKQFSGKTLAENDYVKEAMQKNIPIVLENVEAKTLSELAGVGIEAKVVVVQSRKDGRGIAVTVLEDADNTAGKDLAKTTRPRAKKEKEIIGSKPDASNGKPSKSHLESKETSGALKTETLPVSLDIISKQTLEAIKTTKTRSNKRIIDNRSGMIFKQEDMLIGKGPNETTFSMPALAQTNSLPKYAEYHIDLTWSERSWKFSDYTQAFKVDINYNIVLYATTSPLQKWIKISSTGSGVSPGSLTSNSRTNRGFYTEDFYQQFGPYSLSNGERLDESRPQNANNQGNVSVTTGFTVGATTGVDTDGPSVGVSASYSQNKRVDNPISDFEVKNLSDSHYAKFWYSLSRCGGGAYSNWQSLINSSGFTQNVHSLPAWATGNMPGYTEGVWKFPPNHNSDELLYFYQHHYVNKVYLKDYWNARYGSSYGNKRYDKFFTVNLSKVQLPHLGIDGSTRQSSVSHNGHNSRAVDGDINGAWRGNSVTHTRREANPYWEITLDERYTNTVIQELELWNRTDCCSSRLSNYRIFVSDTPFTSTNLNTTIAQANNSNGRITMINHTGANGKNKTFTLGRTGRYIRVQLNGTDYLSLAEVRIVPKGFH